ncbi:MAG: hypothetical protein IJZ89_02235 [Clostridia bacterium]|nr:hypothetical protein [Clostridia bacterium]
MTWLYIALAIHVLCCILVLWGLIFKILKVHRYMFFVALLLPFWGVLIVIILHFQIFIKGDGKKEIGIEKMKLESEIYRSIAVEDQKSSFTAIPIEEALIVNTAKERREIIMDVLNDNPKEYIEFLQKAGNNDDTEVVHYAVTAMVEISKENDYMLQQLERRHSADPEDYDVLTEYCDFLWHCLEQNLMQGQLEIMNRNLFADLAKKKLAIKDSITDHVRLTVNYFKLGNYTEAGASIERLEELFPNSEKLILLKLQYYASLGRGESIKELIDEVESKHIYLSAAAKEAIAFWRE